MAIKSFNINPDVYDRFLLFCKSNGLSMSKQIEFFMQSYIEEDPVAKKDCLAKLERIRSGKFTKVDNFAQRYGL